MATWGRSGIIPLEVKSPRLELALGPNQVSREDGKRRIVIVSANVRGRDIGSFVSRCGAKRFSNEVQSASRLLDDVGVGSSSNCSRRRKRLQIVVPVALLLVFTLLFMMFGNLKDGLLVFSGIPFALTGGVIALWLRDIPMSISAACRVHRIVGRGGVERIGNDRVHSHICGRRG
jgi:cobalt-zinc-cadmium resistance protein CzcA